MLNRLLYLSSLLFFSYSPFQANKIKIFLAGDSTCSIKEKKYYPETGWGMPFVNFWNEDAEVVNKAKNGRSTKTCISEGIWSSIMDEIKPGDYVFIQFGHNDEVPTKVNTYTTPDQFKANLEKFVSDTRLKSGIPILLTPVSRRKFDEKGIAQETHPYSPFVKEVSNKLNVPIIDLDKLSIALYQQMGIENSKLLFLQLKAGEHPNYPDGKEDNTHFSELGARLIAQLVLQEMKNLKLDVCNYIVTPGKK